MITEKFKEIAPELKENEPMSRHTSFRIGGPADMFVSVKSKEELIGLITTARETSTPFMIMGNGSNMLVGDGGIRGLVIQIGAGLTGFETLSGIPGTLGGGVFMNAGAYGGEIKDLVRSVTYVDNGGIVHTVDGKDCGFGYRTSIFTGGGMYIISVTAELREGNRADIEAAMADYNKRRSDKQPLNMPSAGSTFKRPEGYFAGKLIQDAGLTGCKIGGAKVSEKHAGFVVNTGGATAKDVLTLIEHVRKTVEEKFGVTLEPEVRLVGEG